MIIAIVGESGAGKSTLAKKIQEKFGFRSIITYTTRPIREGEQNHVDYHFIDEEDYKIKDESGVFCLRANYRGWHYATDISDIVDGTVIVVTPAGLRELQRLNLDIKSIYLRVPRRDRLVKILMRGDDIEEAYRRSLSDVGQFDGIDTEVDIVLNNMGYKLSPDELVEKIQLKEGSI